jgi:ribosomal protein L7/L12
MSDFEQNSTTTTTEDGSSPASDAAGVMPHDADEDTLRAVYYRLRTEHSEAACIVADWLLGESVEEWAVTNAGRFSQKIEFVKEIRAKFDLPLKEAKQVADEAMARVA